MEYSLERPFGVSSCGWVDRMLDWETDGLGSTPVLNFFILNLPPKTGQSRLAWLVFFLNCPKINSVFQIS